MDPGSPIRAARAPPPGDAGTRAGTGDGSGRPGASGSGACGPLRVSVRSAVVVAAVLGLITGCAGSPPAAPGSGTARIPSVVLTPPPAPKPEPGEPAPVYSVAVEDVPAGELLFALARDAGLDVGIGPALDARVTMNAVDAPLPELLRRISRQTGLRIEVEDGALAVRRDEPVLRTYPIDYVPFTRGLETMNEVGTGLGSRAESSSGDENGSAANVQGKAEHRFWDTLVESVRGVLGESPDEASNVFAHRETSLIAVRARAARHRELARFLDHVLASARRQVLIEATIVEVDLSDRFRGGVDFARVFGDVEAESALLGGNLGTPPFAGLSIPDLSLTVRLLAEFGEVRVLSTPLVMALNNQTAIVKITENRGFFTSEVRTTSNDGAVERNVETRLHTVPVGLVLLVTPSVAADGEVILKVRPTVTRQTGFVVDPNPTLAEAEVVSRIPEIAVREIESVLRLRSGEVAVLGGLMQEESREDTTGVPLLSRLPWIGAAFRYRDRRKDKTELIVFLRPTVVHDPGLAGHPGNLRHHWPPGGAPAAFASAGRTPASAPEAEAADEAPRVRLERAWGVHPADALLESAWTAFRRGDHRRARAAYREALAARPADASAGLGAVALREGRTGEARAWYRRLLALDPEHEIGRGMSAVLDLGTSPETRAQALSERLARAPESAWLRVALGNVLAGQGRWQAAADAYREAHRNAPSNPDPIYNLAVSADRLGRPAAALARYREAVELAALSPPAFDVRAARARIAALEGGEETRP